MFGRLYVIISTYKVILEEMPSEVVALYSSFYVPYILFTIIAASFLVIMPLLKWKGSDANRLLLRVVDHYACDVGLE
jgi:hypothetical protein